MSESPSIWYRVGYALERARQEPVTRKLRGLESRRNVGEAASKDRPPPRSRQRDEPEATEPRDDALDALIATAAGAVAGKVFGLLPAQRSPGVLALLRAGAAGAGAALLRELLDPLLRGESRIPQLGPAAKEALFAGAARGLLYAAVVEPRLAGPATVRGLLYGSIEYAVSPWGGLTHLLGDRVPHHRIPLLEGLFEDYALGEDSYLDHLVFGVALGVLYGTDAPDTSSGTDDDR
jgi:hypothetical protein